MNEERPSREPLDDEVDVSLIRWMLARSPEERLAVLQGFVDSVAALTAPAPHATPATWVQGRARGARRARGKASCVPMRAASKAPVVTC